jgi:hypothetical protein
MPYSNQRDPNAADSTSASSYPISKGFAITILIAVGILAMLRYFFGSVRVEAGVK